MKEIRLTKGLVALVDDQDFERVSAYKWGAVKTGAKTYAKRGSLESDGKRNTTFLMHRQIVGITDSKILIDHIDGNSLNNQRSNLRISNVSQNLCNRPAPKNNTSGIKGVSMQKSTGKWIVQVSHKHIGVFDTLGAAAHAYNEAAKIKHGEFAHLNKI